MRSDVVLHSDLLDVDDLLKPILDVIFSSDVIVLI